MLHTSEKYSAACVLSSMNLNRYDDWKDLFLDGYHAVEYGIFFLDAVNEEFLLKTRKFPFAQRISKFLESIKLYELQEKFVRWTSKRGFERVAAGATNGRPLGLGVLGFHAYLQQKGISIESEEAREINIEIFQRLRFYSERATARLAQEYGEPKWCHKVGRRNTHTNAVAPTISNSILCNGISPGIEPLRSNYFAAAGAKTNQVRKNPYLEKLLERRGFNSPEIWQSISEQNGSVQHLSFLSPEEKEIFKTSYEIDQFALLQLAADRQPFIDQGQSLNHYVDDEEEADVIIDYYVKAWELGLKSVYYLKSRSHMKKRVTVEKVEIFTRPGCIYCQKTKELLKSFEIPFREFPKEGGRVPEIYINGEILENGYQSLVELIDSQTHRDGLRQIEEIACSGCDG
jgi:ribonucleoside-diphosphate reductase alpha chain